MKGVTIVIAADNLRSQMAKVWEVVKTCVAGGPVEILIRDVKKSRLMEKKYRAMCGDISKQCQVPVTDFEGNLIEGQFRKYDSDCWYAIHMNLYEMSLNEMGETLKSPSRTIVCPYTRRVVTIRASSRDFRKGEAGGFIEYLYAWGVEHNVQWKENYLDFYEQYKARW